MKRLLSFFVSISILMGTIVTSQPMVFGSDDFADSEVGLSEKENQADIELTRIQDGYDTIYEAGNAGSLYFNSETGSIVFYNNNHFAENLEIPETINGVAVRNIATDIFGLALSKLKTVKIPKTVEIINDNNFRGGADIENIIVDEENKNYSSLNGVLYNKDKTKLYMCGGAVTSVEIPDSVIDIGKNAFYCTDVKSVTIPEGVTNIRENTFYGCKNLTDITIPKNVTSIEKEALSGCDNLKNINVSADNKNYSALDGVLYNKNKTHLILCGGAVTSVDIPYTVSVIEENAFLQCKGLENIEIPNNVISIGDSAFKDSYIKNIQIPNSITSIGNNVFSGCGKLKNIELPNSIVSIGNGAFSDSAIKGIELPNSVTSIGDAAFSWCDNLMSVEIPDGVTSIGNRVFSYCYYLENIELPNSVTSIGDGAFSNCYALENLKIPNGVTTIGDYMFNECAALVSVDIPDSVTTIGEYVFSHCTSLKSIKLPSNVINIGSGVFESCDELKSVEIPSSATSMGSSIFSNCSSLESVKIPEGITKIDFATFFNCYSLKSLTIPKSVTEIDGSAFMDCNKEKLVFYVVKDSYAESYAKENSFKYEYITSGGDIENSTETTTEDTTINDKTDGLIRQGEYVKMGNYLGKDILWRCVDIDENGALMLSDRIICVKAFDAAGTNTKGSHGRGYVSDSGEYVRQRTGSNYWGDSNIRDWLNSNTSAGNVVWSCGNSPNAENVTSDAYDKEAGFLTNFTNDELLAIKEVTQKSLLNGYEYSSSKNFYSHTFAWNIKNVVENYDYAYSENVTDKMFLLDVKQVNAVYKNFKDYYKAKPTVTAVENSNYKADSFNTDSYWYYWLRTPYTDSKRSSGDAVRYVDSYGGVWGMRDGLNDGDCAYGHYGIRPAFYLNSSKIKFQTGSGTEKNPYSMPVEDIEKSLISGDADGDGICQVNDASIVLQKVLDKKYVLPIEEKTKNYLKYLDVDQNGVLTATDVSIILKKAIESQSVAEAQ